MANIKINDCYFHSIIHGSDKSLKVIDGILSSGSIKSAKSLGVEVRSGCHTEKDICLSKISKNKNVRGIVSSFDLYLPRLTSFIIDKSISNTHKIIRPRVVPAGNLYKHAAGSATNIYDEYRVREDISLDQVIGICLPYNILVDEPVNFMQFLSEDILMSYYNGYLEQWLIEKIQSEQSNTKAKTMRIEILETYIHEIEKMLEKYDRDIPIYNYDKKDNRQFLYRR